MSQALFDCIGKLKKENNILKKELQEAEERISELKDDLAIARMREA